MDNLDFQVEHPQTSQEAWRKVVSTQRKRAVVACFRMVAMYSLPRYGTTVVASSTLTAQLWIFWMHLGVHGMA